MNEDELTVPLAAAELGVTEDAVRGWLRSGMLRGSLVQKDTRNPTSWLIPRTEVERWKALRNLGTE